MEFPRASGILLHPTSLPGRFGIGDLGPNAFAFIDALAEAGQTYWQILPLGPTGYGDSPYQCFSAFAGNTLLISPEVVAGDGFLHDDELSDLPAMSDHKVDYGTVYEWKKQLLASAFERSEQADPGLISEFETFVHEKGSWLEDYSLYRALKEDNGQRSWQEWPEPLKLRDAGALHDARERLNRQTLAHKFYQFLFFRQWNAVKRYAGERGIKIIGDIPIFVALDSADVWCAQDQFKLDERGDPIVVAGVPPDYFSKTGQLWGNPIYDWGAMEASGFRWWVERVAATLQMVDAVRMDHFRGFAAAWEVPGKDKTAENGAWVDVPGRALFNTLREAFGTLPVIAEDLGVITPDVESLRDDFGFPGMRILQFAFSGDANNHDLPHNYIRNCVAYTGSHDNDTTVGWWNSRAGAGSTRGAKEIRREHEYCKRYLGTDGREIHWDLIRAVMASVAQTAIVPMQDILGIGSEGRMNLPASSSGNWFWRLRAGEFDRELIDRLREMTETYGRSR